MVHIHAEGPAFFCWIPKLFGKRVICTIHGLDWDREKWRGSVASKFIRGGEKNAVKYADEIIVLSKDVQKYFLETYGRETHFIPNGVNRPEVREAKLITDHFGLEKDSYILFLGRLVPEKGIRYLVEAFKNVKTDKKLVIAGGSSDTDSFMEELKELAKGDDRILFTGFVQGAKVRCGNCRRAMGYDYKQASPIFWCREGQELIGQTKCSSEIFQANDIENAVFQALKKELSLLGSLYGDIKKEEQSLKEASRKASRRKTSMEQELKNLKGEKMRMYEEYAAGTLSLDNYKNKKQEYDRKIAEVQDKIEQSKAAEAAQSVVPGTVRAAAEQAENFLHGTRLTASMVSAFIENVYVHEGGRIVVQFKYEQSIQDAIRALHTD